MQRRTRPGARCTPRLDPWHPYSRAPCSTRRRSSSNCRRKSFSCSCTAGGTGPTKRGPLLPPRPPSQARSRGPSRIGPGPGPDRRASPRSSPPRSIRSRSRCSRSFNSRVRRSATSCSPAACRCSIAIRTCSIRSAFGMSWPRAGPERDSGRRSVSPPGGRRATRRRSSFAIRCSTSLASASFPFATSSFHSARDASKCRDSSRRSGSRESTAGPPPSRRPTGRHSRGTSPSGPRRSICRSSARGPPSLGGGGGPSCPRARPPAETTDNTTNSTKDGWNFISVLLIGCWASCHQRRPKTSSAFPLCFPSCSQRFQPRLPHALLGPCPMRNR